MNAAPPTEPFLFSPAVADDGGGETSSSSAGSFWNPTKPHTSNAASLVDQTRNEISQIVREIASACESDRDRGAYVRFLADRVLRAMAGHGVILWAVDHTAASLGFRAEHRLGVATDVSFDDAAKRVHERLLAEVAMEPQPVVVPPTPGAADPETPANPADHPAAIVPIRIDPTAAIPELLIEVFLDSGGTVASQRGCLRFLAQIADLAGEFFRLDLLRGFQRNDAMLRRADRVIEAMHRMPDSKRIEALLVDVIAETLAVPRVALCGGRGEPKRTRILAVSHVAKIDHLSDAADQIRAAAVSSLVPLNELHVWQHPRDSADVDDAASEADVMRVPWVAATSPRSYFRIVATGTCADLRPEDQVFLRRLLDGTRHAWLAARRWESLPGVRWWGGFVDRRALPLSTDIAALIRGGAGTTQTHAEEECDATEAGKPSLRRRTLVMIAACVTAVLLAMLPIPRLVPATGVMRPESLVTYRALHDAIVADLHVRHGQSVKRGDVLATLVSREFQEQRTTLLGRRAVLMQRAIQVNQSLVASREQPGRGQTGQPSDVQSGREVEEEVVAIDLQLQVLDRAEADLIVRATRDGRVDAWQLDQRLAGRPLRRGDEIVKVIGDDSLWMVEARIPQEKVAVLSRAMQTHALFATASPQWSPGETVDAINPQWGHVVVDPHDATAAVMVRFTLRARPATEASSLADAPARVSIHCGRVTLGWFLVEEIVNWCHTIKGLYLG